MILKEAFRMQNYLSTLSAEAQEFLGVRSNVAKITETHLRTKSNPAAENEVKEIVPETDYDPNKVIELYLDILAEREKLAKAISKAKASADIDMDATIMSNKDKQVAIMRLRTLDRMKAEESERSERDHLINNEGNQSAYVYKVKTVTEINFDRNMVKGMIKRLVRETDEASAKIDLLNVTLQVDYEPKYEIENSFDDVYTAFVQ